MSARVGGGVGTLTGREGETKGGLPQGETKGGLPQVETKGGLPQGHNALQEAKKGAVS